LQLDFITVKNSSLQNPTETIIEQGLQPENQNLEGENFALWKEIKSYLDAGKSPDWIAKNLPDLPRNYQSARKIVDTLIQQHNQEN